jgi:hypothetical protein
MVSTGIYPSMAVTLRNATRRSGDCEPSGLDGAGHLDPHWPFGYATDFWGERPSVIDGRHGSQALRTGAEHRSNHRVHIARVCSMVDHRGAQHCPTLDCCSREYHVTSFLQVCRDRCLKLIITGTIAKADNVQPDRCHPMKQWFGIDRCSQPPRQRTAALGNVPESVSAVRLDGHPDLEGTKAARQVRAKIHRPRPASREPTHLAP